MRDSLSAISVFFTFFFLGVAYLIVVPLNSGPEEINHVQAAWYIGDNPSRIIETDLQITSKFPNSIRLENPQGYLRNLDCFSQKMEMPANCQTRSKSGETIETVPFIKRSLIYPLVIGTAMHVIPTEDKFIIARLTSFILCYLLLAASIALLKKSRFELSWLLIPITSSTVFLYAVVNPSALEIGASIFFTSIVIALNRNLTHGNLLFWLGFTLLATNRSLGSLWALIILVLNFLLTGKFYFLKSSLIAAFFFNCAQLVLGNTSYPMSPSGTFQPPWNFYLEEAVRVFNGSGDWIVSIWGVLAWSEIKLPLILVFLNFICFVFLLLKITDGHEFQKRFLLTCVAVIYFIPFAIAVAFSRDWPGFWQGRYSIPIFVAVALISFSCKASGHHKKLADFSIFIAMSSQVYMILLTYARFNYGLYGTNTPIIANGNSFGFMRNALFFTFFVLFCLSAIMGSKSFHIFARPNAKKYRK